MNPEEDENVHRLEGSGNQKGGLIVKKKVATFKVPQPSLLGLDKLAAQRRKEREENARKISFLNKEDDSSSSSDSSDEDQTKPKIERKYRAVNEETPTYTGGISKEARERLLDRLAKNREKGVYASTKDQKVHKDRSDRRYDRHDRNRYDRDRRHRSRSAHREPGTPRFRDEPRTPNLKIKDTVAKSSWDEDDNETSARSSWDFPTPSVYKHGVEWSERSYKKEPMSERSFKSERDSKKYEKFDKLIKKEKHSHRSDRKGKFVDDTPRPTPAHRYNAWEKDRKRTGATPNVENEHIKWKTEEDRELWEEEQQRLDREWYNIDEGIYV